MTHELKNEWDWKSVLTLSVPPDRVVATEVSPVIAML